MHQPPAYATFEDAYLDVLAHIDGAFEYRNAPRGNSSHECLGLSFRLSDPRQRVPYLAARRVNPVFHFAEALWYLAGRDDLAMMAHYSPRMRDFSRDGVTIGSAYGARLFNPVPGSGQSQFDRVLDLLRTEADSKRAVLSVFRPEELAVANNPDVSCVVALHLLAREGRLHMVCYMRANDANRGLIADIFSFTLIQEFAANLLGLELGSYTHHVGSLHLGERDLPQVQRVLGEARTRDTSPVRAFPFLELPRETTFQTIASVLEHEHLLRINQAAYEPDDIAALGLPRYWQQVLLLFEAHRQITHHPGEPVTEPVLAALDPGFRWLMARRWPRRIAPAGGGR
ncbi:thymidylate synthase [Streptomyces profundus]|uniref:thymidylate synthase n=1 Tax=Streptomyces profundus TaxID=2867410 RepID=UPI001D166870|nr:thymidylate synthase [Streptomyces sp. MA3_2.13]UED85410.1 thymidylate synthase [Streptomyces sp. MA3_2.13]